MNKFPTPSNSRVKATRVAFSVALLLVFFLTWSYFFVLPLFPHNGPGAVPDQLLTAPSWKNSPAMTGSVQLDHPEAAIIRSMHVFATPILSPTIFGASNHVHADVPDAVSRTPTYVTTPLVTTNAGSEQVRTDGTIATVGEIAVAVVVDATQTQQTMDGFGATHVSLVYEGGVGDVLGDSLRIEAINAIYNEVALNLGNLEGALLESPGSYDQRTNDNDEPANFNWNGFQIFGATAMKQKVVDLAAPFGFDTYFLGQKINSRWASPWLNDIRSTDYTRYLNEAAEQVSAGQIYWRDTFNIVPKYQMLFNEPLSGNKELAGGSEQEVVDLVKSAGARLREDGFAQIKFVVPNEETITRSTNVASTILADVDARQYVGAIGYHTYPYGSIYASIPNILSTSGTGKPNVEQIEMRNIIRDLGQQYGLPVWMTEVSHGGVDPLSFDALLGRAIHIHDELVYANAAAYFGMNSMWDTESQQMHFGNRNLLGPSNEGNIVFIDTDTDTVYISGMGYAIGHYARWIEQGAVRVEATSDDALLQVTAFRDEGVGRLVLVLINNAPSARTVTVTINGLELGSSLIGEQSTSAEYWQPLAPFALLSANSFVITVPARSVTSLAEETSQSTPTATHTPTSISTGSLTPTPSPTPTTTAFSNTTFLPLTTH